MLHASLQVEDEGTAARIGAVKLRPSAMNSELRNVLKYLGL